jgi:two-component system, chemotaxis family, response regulator PixG
MSTVTDPFITDLTQDLDRLHQEKATGEMILRYQDMSVTLYLLAGRLQYAVDKKYRVRRWQRAVTQYCRDWQVPTQMLNSQPWEYDFLYQGLSKSKITLEQAKAVIKSVTEECLYEMGLMAQVEKKWIPHDRVKSTFSYFLSLSLAEIHPVLIEIAEMHNQWEREHLQVLNLSLSPVLTEKGKAIPNPALQKYLNGQYTMWDVALQLKQPITRVARSLIPWQEKGLLEFKTIADLPSPVEAIPETASNASNVTPLKTSASKDKKEFLIACIDDSPIVIHNLKSILTPAGFRVLSIQEPMAGFALLIEQKPDLILLDLNMPNANGYSICKFLRETPVFGKTPIIILTAQDSSIDRTRAKLVGANDFISKPPGTQALIDLIKNHLPQAKQALDHLAG